MVISKSKVVPEEKRKEEKVSEKVVY